MNSETTALIFTAGISFLLGFKIAAYMGRRQLERMKAIWSRTESDKRSAK